MKLTDLGFEHVNKVTTLQIHSQIVNLNTFGTEGPKNVIKKEQEAMWKIYLALAHRFILTRLAQFPAQFNCEILMYCNVLNHDKCIAYVSVVSDIQL